MTELELRDGDYVADGAGGLRQVTGDAALLQRVLFRLTARRGTFPFWERLGSRLWQLGQVSPAGRQAAARQYVAEALAEEPVQVEAVTLEERDGRGFLTVELLAEGRTLSAAVEVR